MFIGIMVILKKDTKKLRLEQYLQKNVSWQLDTLRISARTSINIIRESGYQNLNKTYHNNLIILAEHCLHLLQKLEILAHAYTKKKN